MILRLALCGGIALTLSGCGAMPAWLGIVGPALSWAASVNNVGAEWMKLSDDRQAEAPQAK